eukprot:314659-Amphidinium_carterae.1
MGMFGVASGQEREYVGMRKRRNEHLFDFVEKKRFSLFWGTFGGQGSDSNVSRFQRFLVPGVGAIRRFRWGLVGKSSDRLSMTCCMATIRTNSASRRSSSSVQQKVCCRHQAPHHVETPTYIKRPPPTLIHLQCNTYPEGVRREKLMSRMSLMRADCQCVGTPLKSPFENFLSEPRPRTRDCLIFPHKSPPHFKFAFN